MDAGEALDQELIAERAEALRAWLAALPLPRPIGPLERELAAILANDPGGYIDGQRPLAGLTVERFVAELAAPGAGAVGRVRGIGPGDLDELREALGAPAGATPADAPPAPPTPPAAPFAPTDAAPADAAPAAPAAPFAPTDAAPADAAPAAPTAPFAPTPPAPTPPTPRPRGRPRRADAPPAPEGAPAQAPAPRPRGRPRRADAPPAPAAPETPPAPAPPAADEDSALRQLRQLWPALHPHARRAVVLYASTLLAEAPHDT
jgi:hypothetical protein